MAEDDGVWGVVRQALDALIQGVGLDRPPPRRTTVLPPRRPKRFEVRLPSAADPSATDPAGDALRHAIWSAPDDPAPWLVYADWLVERGNVRGHFMNAMARDEDLAPWLDQHADVLLGPLADEYAFVFSCTWHLGFWRSAWLGVTWHRDLPENVDIAPFVPYVLRHPSAQFLQELRLGLPSVEMPNWQSCLDAVVASGVFPHLHRLFVGDFRRPEDSEISWATIGSLARIWAALPGLRELTVQGGLIDLGPIDAPRLEAMRLWTGGLMGTTLQQIADAEFPALVDLELWLGCDEYGGTCRSGDVERLLESPGLPVLRRLGLMNYDAMDDLVPLIVQAPLLPRLTALDLSMGTMTDTGGRMVLEHAASFAHLERLDLDRNGLSEELCDALSAALGDIVSTSGQERDGVYVSVGE